MSDTRGSVGQVNISLSQCRDFNFPVPSMDEQVEIVRRIEDLFALADKVQAQYYVAKSRIDKLTPALLAKAFRGELVPQDPNDEPAHKLLERLQARQGEAAKLPRKVRKVKAVP
jgi:type I restriction enzyme S subunit